MQFGNIPSPDAYVKKFCEVNRVGEEFMIQTLVLLEYMVASCVRENNHARLAAIALHLHAIQVKQHKLTDAIARMEKITPHVLMGLARDARLKLAHQVGKD